MRSRATASARHSGTLAETKDVLRGLIHDATGVPPDRIADDSSIDGDLAMDSLSLISLQVGIEKVLNVDCDPAELMERNRFDAVASFLHARRVAAPTDAPASARAEARTAGRPRRGRAPRGR